jgi:hypothetical protein
VTRSNLAAALVGAVLILSIAVILVGAALVDRPSSGDTTPTRTTTDPAVAPATSGAPAAVPDGARGATGPSAWPESPPDPARGSAPPVAPSP